MSERRLESLVRPLLSRDVALAIEPIDERAHFAYDAEAQLVASSVEKRRREFATGRRLAHRLLEQRGLPAVALLRGVDRAPRWPHGITGSISHDDQICVVAVAPSAAIRSLGIDVEPAAPLPRDVFDLVLREEERAALAARSPAQCELLARLMFSAKESVYKALAPIVRTILEFHDVGLEIDDLPLGHESGSDADSVSVGSMRARLLRTDLPFAADETIVVTYVVESGRILTAVLLPAAACAP